MEKHQIIKDYIRKTPAIKIWRKWNRLLEYRRLMHYNNTYKKELTPLHDKCFLDNFINEYQKRVESNISMPYYIIGIRHDKTGIFGYINNYLPHIAYALTQGFIPVIDMKNYPSIYQKGQENAWEKFFLQPCGRGLGEINSQKTLHAPDDLWYRWAPNTCPLMTDEEISFWGRIYNQFIKYNAETKKYLSVELATILKNPSKTIGVIYRGTDYTQGQAVGCPRQPTMEMLSSKVKEMLELYDLEYIYLASDERKIVEYMKEEFPGKVLINKRVYYDEAKNVDYSNYNNDHIGISGARFDRENNEYLIGIEYISTINLVAHCECLVAGACGGTTAALYLNNLRFKDKYVFELGKYGAE